MSSNKKQSKKKKGKQVLANALVTEAKATELQKDQLKNCIKEKLEQMFVRPFSSAEVLGDMNEEDKKELFNLPKNERAKKFKLLKSQKKSEASKNLLPKEYQTGLVFGLKKCLKGMEQNSLKALIYDTEVNVESIKVLFDKGQIPMVALPGISGVVRSVTGFPAMCLGLPAKSDDVVQDFFEPLMTLINQVPGIKVLKEGDKKENKLPDVVPKNEPKVTKIVKPTEVPLKCPIVTLLKRDSIKERAWEPPVEEVKTLKDEDAFMGDFISFASNKRTGSALKSSKYKKTKLEIMK